MGEYAFTAFGPDANSWDADDTGSPGIGLVGRALQVWSTCQQRDVTLGEAALAFRLPIAMIAEAVEAHPWMFVYGPPTNPASLIAHEGE